MEIMNISHIPQQGFCSFNSEGKPQFQVDRGPRFQKQFMRTALSSASSSQKKVLSLMRSVPFLLPQIRPGVEAPHVRG